MMRRKQRSSEVVRITGARRGLTEDVRGRERRYVISMLVRTAAVLLTVLLWDVQRPLAVVTLVLGVTLPYIAVVIANAGRENAQSLPTSVLPDPSSRPMLDAADRTLRSEDEQERTVQPESSTGEASNGRSPRPR